ncbi:hypothetical protein A2U01_0080927, partial [Trifolium medium]|nr:hypothetical protein [Trifolium medium]
YQAVDKFDDIPFAWDVVDFLHESCCAISLSHAFISRRRAFISPDLDTPFTSRDRDTASRTNSINYLITDLDNAVIGRQTNHYLFVVR